MGGNVLIMARNAEVLKTAAEEMNQLKIDDLSGFTVKEQVS